MAKRVDSTSMTDVLADVAKKYELSVGALSAVAEPVRALTTGNVAIDYLTGVGGLPLGRGTELYGQPSSGKSTTALQAAAALQRDIIESGRDEYILYLDYEHALDPQYAEALGLDVEHPSFIAVQPVWLEQGAEIALKLIATGNIRLSIWDSVAAMAPQSLVEDTDIDRRTSAMERARLLASVLQRMTGLCMTNDSTAVFLNHLVEAIEMRGRPGLPPRETSPGGKSLKYYASLRLMYKQLGNKKGKALDALTGESVDLDTATHVKVKCIKNKVGDPFRTAEVRVRYGRGFDNAWSALQVLLAHNKISKTGAQYSFNPKRVPDLMHPALGTKQSGVATILGENKVLQFADQHPDWAAALIAHAVQIVDQHGGDALAVDDDIADALLLAQEEGP